LIFKITNPYGMILIGRYQNHRYFTVE